MSACQYCESDRCDTDCYFAAKHFGVKRPTAIEIRAPLIAALLEAVEDIESSVRMEWSCSPLGGHEGDERWKLAQRLRLLANPSPPPAAPGKVET